jgi:hypothetical protein
VINDFTITIKVEVPDLHDLIAAVKDLVSVRADMAADKTTNKVHASTKQIAQPAVANNTGNSALGQLAETISPVAVVAEIASPTEAPTISAGVQSEGATPIHTPTYSKDVAMTKQPAVVAASPLPTGAPVVGTTAPEGAVTPMNYAKDVAPTMMKLLTEQGAPTVAALLAEYGVKKGGELPADKLAEALAKAQAILNG